MKKDPSLPKIGQGVYERTPLLLGLALFIYVAIRSQLLGFTYDEISTLHFARNFEWSAITSTAGIHLLNAWLTALIIDLGFDGAFMIRLPSTLAFAAFAWGAWDLGRHLRKELALVLFIMVVVNPFVLDFFSLSRGYGLGLGALLPSVAFVVRFGESRRFDHAMLALLFGMISVVASYTLLNFLVPLVALLLGVVGLDARPWRERLSRSLVVVLATGLFLLALLPILFALKEKGELYFGGRSDILTDTVSSLGRSWAYHAGYGSVAIVAYQVLFAVSCVLAVWELVRAVIKRSFTPAALVAALLLMGLLAPFAQHLLLDTNLPVERTALMYYPLSALVLVFSMPRSPWRLVRPVSLVLGLLFGVHFIATANLTHTYSWRYDSGTKAAIKYLWEETEGDIRLGIDYIHAPSINYYRDQRYFARLIVTELTGCWDFCLGLEELGMQYYGVERCNKEMDREHIHAFLEPQMDLYYLDDHYLTVMDQLGILYTVVQRYPYSRSNLIGDVRME